MSNIRGLPQSIKAVSHCSDYENDNDNDAKGPVTQAPITRTKTRTVTRTVKMHALDSWWK